MARDNKNFTAFDDYYQTMLEMDPQTAYMGAVGGQDFGRFSPSQQQRGQEYFRGQFSDVYNQYLGRRGQQIASRTDPSKMTSFTDYLAEYPFTQRYSALTPRQRGMSTSRFSPSTRYLLY